MEPSREEIIELTATIKQYMRVQDRHEIILFGRDGDSGLVAAMRELIDWRKVIDDERKSIKGGIWGFVKPALQQVFTGTVFAGGTVIALHLAGVLH